MFFAIWRETPDCSIGQWEGATALPVWILRVSSGGATAGSITFSPSGLWRRVSGSVPRFGVGGLVVAVLREFWNEQTGRVGCLIHPLRVGSPDLRRFAFPFVPTLGDDRALRCPMLDNDTTDFGWNRHQASLTG